MGYGYTRGKVTEHDVAVMRIACEDGEERMIHGTEARLRRCIKESTVGTRIALAWYDETPKIVTSYAACAVERVKQWKRIIEYVPRYRHVGGGHTVEMRTVTHLLETERIRAAHATYFEDEVLGIDIWVLLFLENAWRWIPVDTTTMPLDTTEGIEIVRRAHDSGIVAVSVQGCRYATSEMIIDAWRMLRRRGIGTMYREEARAREIAYSKRARNRRNKS